MGKFPTIPVEDLPFELNDIFTACMMHTPHGQDGDTPSSLSSALVEACAEDEDALRALQILVSFVKGVCITLYMLTYQYDGKDYPVA